jgi:hypothetical protein
MATWAECVTQVVTLIVHAMGNAPFEMVMPCAQHGRLVDCSVPDSLPLDRLLDISLSSFYPSLQIISFSAAIESLSKTNETLQILSWPHDNVEYAWLQGLNCQDTDDVIPPRMQPLDAK